jgi:signal transduction histidine kinase
MILDKKQLWILWTGLGFFILAFIWDAIFTGDRNLERYQRTIQSNLNAYERAAEAVMRDTAFIERRLRVSINHLKLDEDIARIERLQKEPFNIVILKGDSAVFWTKHDVLPLKGEIQHEEDEIGRTYVKLAKLKQSDYVLRFRRLPPFADTEGGGATRIVALIPLKKDYKSFEGKYLKKHFVSSPLLPDNLELEKYDLNAKSYKSKYAIKSIGGETIGTLALEEENDKLHDWGMLFCLTIGFFMLGAFGDRISKQMLLQYESPMLGITFFIGSLIALRSCIYFIEHSGLFPSTHLEIGQYNTAVFMSSLPELLINTAFLFWFAVFFNKEFRLTGFRTHPLFMRWILAVGFYTVVVLLNVLCIGIYYDLVNNWADVMTFENLTEFEVSTIFALFSLAFIQFSMFLLSHRLLITIRDLGLSELMHFFAADVAVAIGILLYNSYAFQSGVPISFFVVGLFLYLLAFHLFTRSKSQSFMWLVNWVLLLAALQAFYISRFSIEHEMNEMEKLSSSLSTERDLGAEKNIKLLSDTIANDRFINTWTIFPLRAGQDPKKIEESVKRYFEDNDYLSDHYTMRFSGMNSMNEAVINPDSIKLQTLIERLNTGVKLKECGCTFWSDNQGNNAYLSLVTLRLSPNQFLTIPMEFTRSDKLSSRIFTEILAEKHFKMLPRLNDYHYAIYKNRLNIEENHHHDEYDEVIREEDIPTPGTFKTIQNDKFFEKIYQNSDAKVIVRISKIVPVASQVFTLWVYFVLVLIFLLLTLTALNQWARFLPEVAHFSLVTSFNTSLRNRIMVPIILFILVSYGVIFYFTFSHFKKVGDRYYTESFKNTSKTIIKKIGKDIQNLPLDTDFPLKESALSELLIRNAENYETAMHLYNSSGVLLATTEPNIFDKGILSTRLNPTAYLKLNSGQEREIHLDENIGDYHYKTSYYAVHDATGSTILGYLELPYYEGDRALRLSAADIWSHNATILTLLFILCIATIYIQTNKLMAPLQQVAETLRRLRVGKTVKNELITWDKRDEIGALISAYNAKVNELEEAVTVIAENERDDAWKEMARQVAHEIRNPLTPMKLVVQHLEMLRLNGIDNLDEYTQRSNRVLIEQIANLEKIVNEFHSYARMPNKATNANFPINDLVQSVADLFSQVQDKERPIEVRLAMPVEKYIVYADRQLLTSAFNNLIKNAIQAIPEDRDGLIRISLYREDNKAVVKISDNGTGIPKDIQDKIFSPNFTTKSYGNGIGLLITKNIITSVNGTIDFDSVENEGTDFYIQLDIQEIQNGLGNSYLISTDEAIPSASRG